MSESDTPVGLQFRTGLPLAGCSPNRREHWSDAYTASRDYRDEVWLDARVALANARPLLGPDHWPPWERVRLSLVFGARRRYHDGRYHPKDPDNALASFKAGIDALVRAGIVVDDNAERVQLGAITIDPDAYGVTVTVEEMPDASE